MYLRRHQIIHFICDLYRNQREIFGITKRRPLPKPKGNIWFYKKAAGRETLGNVVKKVMGKAGFDGHFTNHSLRRSCATNLYDNGVPEQVIQETTGHRSVEGVRGYKRTSSAMNRKMSAILNQSEPSLDSDHERMNTKSERKGVIAKMQRIKLNSMRFQTKRRCLFVISGLMHLTQKVWKKGMTKLKQRGKAAKILLLPLLRRKLKSVISDGNCKLRIFFVLKILIVVFLIVSSQ